MRLTKIFHSQSGRSLVEILAVLAIMGILSLAGILGVQYAMEANRENETLNRFSKVVAGARTSRILDTLGEKTKFNQNTGEERDEYVKMPVNMSDVISNIGGDIYAVDATDLDGKASVISHIWAPLKGPFKDGTEERVEIRVYVETPYAFTVHADNLTFNACMKIVQADLGYSFTYDEGSEDWKQPSQVQTAEGAKALCEKIAPQNKTGGDTAMVYSPFIRRAVAASPSSSAPGTLVMWFGPYACMGNNCAAGKCEGAECCCTFEDGGREVSLTDPAPVGCAAVNGKCVGCAQPDSKGICKPKSGISSCEPKCTLDICQNANNPYYCGDGLCCPSAAACGNGKCVTTPPVECKGDRPITCGAQCCSTDETCNEEKGICEPLKKCTGAQQTCSKQTDGSFSHCCGPTETCCGTACCAANQQCGDFGKCESIKCNESSPTYCAPNLCCNPANSKCDKEKGECIVACPAGETQYCAEESKVKTEQIGVCSIKTSDCLRYACTKETLILKDPSGPRKRSLEVPLKGIKGFSYCADEINGKCALVTYCDTAPVATQGHMLQRCDSCTTVNTGVPSGFWNPRTEVCKGDKIVKISALVDKKDVLIIGKCQGVECSLCPRMTNFAVIAGGGCCNLDTHTAWISCSHCENPSVVIDNCGRTMAAMDICCPKGEGTNQGCTSPEKQGRCLENFPVEGQCCENSCPSEGGGNECCASEDIANTDEGKEVCCSDSEPSTKACCEKKDRHWEEEDGEGTCCEADKWCADASGDPEKGTCCTGEQNCNDTTHNCEDKPKCPGQTYSELYVKKGNEDGCCDNDKACPTECCEGEKVCAG